MIYTHLLTYCRAQQTGVALGFPNTSAPDFSFPGINPFKLCICLLNKMYSPFLYLGYIKLYEPLKVI